MVIHTAQWLLPAGDLPATQAFFVALGFRIEAIAPADDPRVVVLAGHGLRVRLDRDHTGDPGTLRLVTDSTHSEPEQRTAPNGTRVVIAARSASVLVPPLAAPQAPIVSRPSETAAWIDGRAGMRYRDLIPGRVGGRFIASHIRIPGAGPVPDYVHHHAVRFQVIVCRRGWVRVVYDDQGPPFVLRAGDCVLQPPTIRHRVLESGDDLEVVELGCPADHETFVDHDRALPSEQSAPQRRFGGQRFVRHERAATWIPCNSANPGFEQQVSDIGAATDGLASVRFVRRRPGGDATLQLATESDAHELLFAFVLTGEARDFPSATAVTLPSHQPFAMRDCSDGFELLEVRLPAHDLPYSRTP